MRVLIPERDSVLVLVAVGDCVEELLEDGVIVPAPVRVPLLNPVGEGQKEAAAEPLGVPSPETELVAREVGVGDPQDEPLAVRAGDGDVEEERHSEEEKARVVLPEMVAVGVAAEEEEVLEEGEGAFVMPGHTS